MRWFLIGSLLFFLLSFAFVVLLLAFAVWEKSKQLKRLPDGEFIVFRDNVGYAVVDPENGSTQIWLPSKVDLPPLDASLALEGSFLSHSQRFTADDNAGVCCSMSPAGNHFVIVDALELRSDVAIYEVNSFKRTLVKFGTPVLDWSSDGTLLAVICRAGVNEPNQLLIFDTARESITVLAELDYHCTSVDWSPDGKKLLIAGWDGIRIVDLSGAVSVGPGGVLDSAVWSPDGSHFAWRERVDRGPWTIMVSRADGSGVEQMFEVTKHSRSIIGNRAYLGAAGLPCWSPDGKNIAFFAAMEGDCRLQGNGELLGTYGLFVVDVATKKRKRLTSSQDSRPRSMVWVHSERPQKH